MIIQCLFPIQRDIGVFYSFEDSFRANIYQTVIQNLVYNLQYNVIVQVHLNQGFICWDVLNGKNKDIRDPNDIYHLLALYFNYEALFIYIVFDTVLPKLSGRDEVDKG